MDSILLVRDTLLKSHVSVGSPDALLIGLSGGADSVALLVSLCSIAADKQLRLHAVHVNHHLRTNADDDEAFCRELCSKLGIPLTVASVHVSQKGSVEASAREARYAAFRNAMRDTESKAIVLAHHMNDQAETVLMHLLYGTGTTGLAGMKPFSNGVWRPFLGLKREVLRDYLQTSGYDWREDESNADVNFTRNKIRAMLVPVMEECAPEAVASIARTAQIAADEDQLLDALSESWMAENVSGDKRCFFRAETLKGEPVAMQRRILRKCADSQGILLDFEQTERIRNLLNAEGGAIENLPGGGIAFRGDTYLHFLPGGWNSKKQSTLSPLLICDGGSQNTDGYGQPLPKSQIHGLQLRTREAGDYIQPFGMKGTKPLKEYMIERGIERPFRSDWPIVCRGKEVLWVVGVGASEKLRVKNAIAPEYKLIYAGKLPDQF